ncbi:hypothetical protein [Daejeonella sp.]|jgi:hypothetical protein|uniref:hypothetical protein n=1 Tax=Daejeonella sp. TaxID=2805397 RepID=UPI0037BE4A7A
MNKLIENDLIYLKEELGIEIEENVDVKLLFDTKEVKHIVIPFIESDLKEEDLVKMGNGKCSTTFPTTSNHSC